MRKPLYILLCVSITCFLLSGCAGEKREETTQTTSQEIMNPDRMTMADLPEEDLEKPTGVIASLEDYIYLLDYLAFYRIGEKIYISFDPAYAEEIYNPYTVHQKAYALADLADVYACQMDDTHYSDEGVVGIQYSMSKDIASAPPAEISDTPVLTSFDYGCGRKAIAGDAQNNSNVQGSEAAIEEDVKDENNAQNAGETLFAGMEQKEPISCENSEQLYYLVMNGYQPVPKEGSIAEQLLGQAKEILREMIDPSMTDFQKIKAVYDWLTTEVRYDSGTAYSTETYLVKEQAYYLEGVFLNHCAVCDGKAKAYALLLNLIGIPCYRTTGVNEGGDHAWNMVQLDGQWYISCSTYGQKNRTDSLGWIVPDYGMLLTDAKTPYDWYPAQKHTDVESMLSQEPFDVYGQMGEDDGISLKVSSLSELKTLLKEAEGFGKESYKVEFQYTGDSKDEFEKEMTAYLEGIPEANAAEVRVSSGIAYQIFLP